MKNRNKQGMNPKLMGILVIGAIALIIYLSVAQTGSVIYYSHGNDSAQHWLNYNSGHYYKYHPLTAGEFVDYLTVDTKGTSSDDSVYFVFAYTDGSTFQTPSQSVPYLYWVTQTFTNPNQGKGVNEIKVVGGSNTYVQNFLYYNPLPKQMIIPAVTQTSIDPTTGKPVTQPVVQEQTFFQKVNAWISNLLSKLFGGKK